MDIERFQGQKQPDLPGMPQEPKRERPKFNTEKRKPIISGNDFISQKEMREIWNKKMAEKKRIKTLWVELISADSGGRGKSDDEISLDSAGIFRINGEREIKYDEAKKLIEQNFASPKDKEILNKIEEILSKIEEAKKK